MDLSSDNFEYIFQLTKVLSAECRANRQEREKLEILLKRLAKQSGISYDQFNEDVKPEIELAFRELAISDETKQLVYENYQLLYQIELQEYINRKIRVLINEISDHLNSIRSFVIERKLTGFQNIDNYLEERFHTREEHLVLNIKSLRQSKAVTQEKLELLVQELQSLFSQIDWDSVPKGSNTYVTLKSKINDLENNYNFKVLNESINLT